MKPVVWLPIGAFFLCFVFTCFCDNSYGLMREFYGTWAVVFGFVVGLSTVVLAFEWRNL